MKLIAQIGPLLGRMASERGQSALEDKARDNSSLIFFPSFPSCRGYERSDIKSSEYVHSFPSLASASSFAVRNVFSHVKSSICFHVLLPLVVGLKFYLRKVKSLHPILWVTLVFPPVPVRTLPFDIVPYISISIYRSIDI